MHFYSELTKNKKMRVSSKRGRSLQILNLKKLKNKIPIAGEPQRTTPNFHEKLKTYFTKENTENQKERILFKTYNLNNHANIFILQPL